MIFLLLIEVICVYSALDQQQASLLNSITFWILSIVNIVIMCYLLTQLDKLKEETFHSEKTKIQR